jgi:hypothetical protein
MAVHVFLKAGSERSEHVYSLLGRKFLFTTVDIFHDDITPLNMLLSQFVSDLPVFRI